MSAETTLSLLLDAASAEMQSVAAEAGRLRKRLTRLQPIVARLPAPDHLVTTFLGYTLTGCTQVERITAALQREINKVAALDTQTALDSSAFVAHLVTLADTCGSYLERSQEYYRRVVDRLPKDLQAEADCRLTCLLQSILGRRFTLDPPNTLCLAHLPPASSQGGTGQVIPMSVFLSVTGSSLASSPGGAVQVTPAGEAPPPTDIVVTMPATEPAPGPITEETANAPRKLSKAYRNVLRIVVAEPGVTASQVSKRTGGSPEYEKKVLARCVRWGLLNNHRHDPSSDDECGYYPTPLGLQRATHLRG